MKLKNNKPYIIFSELVEVLMDLKPLAEDPSSFVFEIRPQLIEVLTQLLEHFYLGVYSQEKEVNLMRLVQSIESHFPGSNRTAFLFVLGEESLQDPVGN